MMPTSELTTLGGFAFSANGSVAPRPDTHKGRAIIAFLARNPRTDISRERLLELFWPDTDPEQARNRLKTVLSNIRRCLKATGLDPNDYIIANKSVVRWIPDTVVDASVFAERAGDQALEKSREAMKLYRGDFLEGDYDQWATAERERLSSMYETVLTRLVKRSQDAHAAERLVARDPYNEEAYAALIDTALGQGNRPAAAAWLDRCRESLAELEAKPSTAFEERFGRIDRLRSLDVLPNNLPRQTSSFIGRDNDLVELKRLFSSSQLVTITGTGGVGKTRVVLALGSQLLDSSGEGVWFVDLARVSAAEFAVAEIASSLGVRSQPDTPVLDQLIAYLRNRRVLLLLDNCEHVLSEAARAVATIMKRCPRVRLIATSREPLKVQGEQVYRLQPLQLPPGEDALDATAARRFAAVDLFVARAQSADTRFTFDDDKAPIVARICARLDGIPLGIELAAARITSHSVAKILERLDERFRLLTGGDPTSHPRQQTMRATIDWSHDLLGTTEQVLFRRVSIFQGGWTADAARVVCTDAALDEDAVMDTLAALVNQSLATVDFRGEARRFRLLESVRQYGQDRLEASGESSEAARKHAQFFADFQRPIVKSWRTTPESDWLGRIAEELDNIRAALQWSLGSGRDPLLGARMVIDLWYFFYVLHFDEGRHWLEAARAAVTPESDPKLSLDLDIAITRLLFLVAGEETQEASQRALQAARALGDARLLGRAIYYYGEVRLRLNMLDEAEPALQEALELARRENDRSVISSRLVALSILNRKRGDYVGARELLSQARSLHDTPSLYMFSLIRLEEALHESRAGNLTRSIELVRESLERYEREVVRPGYEVLHIALAHYLMLAGKYDEAVSSARTALEASRREGFGGATTLAIEVFMLLVLKRGMFELAAKLFGYCEADFGRRVRVWESWLDIDTDALEGPLRKQLGAVRFSALRTEGARWGEAQAIEAALGV
jgi:predicted ATPase/DNA-binding SARP family transcriptional activator